MNLYCEHCEWLYCNSGYNNHDNVNSMNDCIIIIIYIQWIIIKIIIANYYYHDVSMCEHLE